MLNVTDLARQKQQIDPSLLQREDDWGGYLWFVVFVVVPLLARFLKWLFTRLGILREQDPVRAEAERRERLARARAQRKQAEREGEELWRRLARGELAEPPQSVPVPAPLPRAAPSSLSLEREEEPQALSVLGDVREPAEAPEVSLEAASLESEAEPTPLEALAQPAASVTPSAPDAARRRAPFVLVAGELRRAVVLSEVLGRPVSERAIGA